MALNYLLDPMFQIENSAGKPATDGWLEVYIHGTREKYYCASNFDGTLHPFKIKLDSLGSNIVLADDGQSYDVYAYNRFGSLLMSRYNVQPGSGGSGSGGEVGTMQHWMGMYGPTYTNFPGDLAGHTLGIPKNEIEYVGDFIDHISTAPYPDGDVPAYIYLKPGLYHIDCVIRYQQSSEDVKNTLDEVLIYTGHGNANEDVAYQLDASGPDTNGNRHCLKQSFIRKVTEEDGGLLYFAPGTPTDWTDAYIQTLSIVKLDSMIYGKAGIPKVTHDDTMTGDGTPDSPLSIQDALDGKQDTLTPGEGITIDSDGNISSETYSEGWGIDIDENNVISVDPDIIQQKLTAGEGITIDEDGTISAETGEPCLWFLDSDGLVQPKDGKHFEVFGVPSYETVWDYYFAKLNRVKSDDTGLRVDYMVASHRGDASTPFGPFNLSATLRTDHSANPYQGSRKAGLVLDDNQTGTGTNPRARIDMYAGSNGGYSVATYRDQTYVQAIVANDYVRMRSDDIIRHVGSVDGHAPFVLVHELDTTKKYVLQPTATAGIYELVEETSGETYAAGIGIIIDSDGNISVDPEVVQEKLTAGDNITIDSDGVISAAGQVQSDWEQDDDSQPDFIKNKPDLSEYQKSLTPGEGINIDSDGVITAEGKSYTEGWGIDIDDENDVISVDPDIIQQKLTPGEGIAIDSDGNISLDLPPVKPLIAGEGITIVDSDNSVIISAAGSAEYTAGYGIEINGEGEIGIDTSVVQEKLTAGEGVNIDSDGVITAEGRQYTEGWGIDIDENNEISVDPSIVQEKLTGGDGIIIDSNGVISVDPDSLPEGPQGPQGPQGPEGPQGEPGTTPPVVPLVAGNNITIEDSNGSVVISAEDATVDQTYDPTSSNAQSGTAVAEAVATKEDEFDAGDGLEFITDSDGNRVLQVEGPVDVVAGPGIVIDNPDGNTLRISLAKDDETLLFYNSDGASGTLQLSENYDNFDRLRVEWDVWADGDYKRTISELPTSVSKCILYATYFNSVNSNCFNMLYTVSLYYNSFSVLGGRYNNWANNTVSNATASNMSIYKIVGIHRIANN